MTTATKPLRENIKFGHSIMAVLALVIMLVPSTTFGVLNLYDTAQGLPNLDNRAGSLLPNALQLTRVENLGARADWNKFGTINTLVKDGGFISTGFNGEPVAAAREWVRQNRELFKLSEQAVSELVLVSDGRMPYTDAHYVLFRQNFGGVIPTQDGQINVSIINGNVFHVWSSSAGDRPAPAAATLTPLQAWLAAATNVGRNVPLSDILSVKQDADNNWTRIQIAGFPQVQQVRLTALPLPLGGIRPAFETNVIYNFGHISEAYTLYVDAQSGNILHRVNRVNYLNPSAEPASPLLPPETQVFTGAYVDSPAPGVCGIRHPYTVPAGKVRIAAVAAAAVPSNDIVLKLYFNNGITDTLLASSDTATSPEAVTYEPTGGVPAGIYKVEVCPFIGPMAPATPPYNYAGTFTTDDTPVNAPTGGLPYPPKWRYFKSNPDLNYGNSDIGFANTFCWESVVNGSPVPGCEFSLKNLASRAPWDYVFAAGAATNTTRGNNAQTAESWGSPLTPSTPYSPVSASREYVYPFTNQWNTSKCDPTIFVPTTGADINRATVHLFATHNRLHDWSYFLGFTEQNSALQLDNFGNTPPTRQNDPEIGNVQAGAVSGGANGMYLGRDNANQITLQDGTPGITNQYLFQPIAAAFYAPCTDGDMDVGIVGHEYHHAVTNRMIGGPDASIGGEQGPSMGESWGDLGGGEYLNSFGYLPTNDESTAAVGVYATGNKQLAIRDYANAPNPLNYSNFGFDTPGPEVHSDGEIWNAVNWGIRQTLIDKYNAQYPYSDVAMRIECAEGKRNPDNCAGNRRWAQLMYDSFLLMPASPTMLNARDSMIAADVARFGGANQVELWRIFGQRGFGQLANAVDGGDVAPIPDFSSPLENNATVTFSVLAGDESNAAITTAKVFVGHYEARTRPIADTDPATTVDTNNVRTNINDNVAQFVPGTYDFVVQAPGYGMHRFTKTFVAGETTAATFTLPTNRASITNGATIITTATVAADQAAKNNLIDDTEDTGARLGSTTTPADDSMIVDLQGTTPVNVTGINVSTTAGPNNAGRFTGIRKFAIDASTNGLTFTTIYTSPDDAFPAERPRPVQPQLNLRSFDVPDTMATHLRMRVLTTQCTGNPGFAGEQDNDPFNATDCATFVPNPNPGPPPTIPTPPGTISRATEFQVFTSAPTTSDLNRFECDVFSRPLGDGVIDSTDVGQVRRFQLGLDPFQTTEFQRADCSIAGTLGDGFVDALDVGQSRRYQLGLDPNQSAGGPIEPAGLSEIAESKNSDSGKGDFAPTNEIRIISQDAAAGSTVTVALETDTSGSESIYGFSLKYDPAVLTYIPNSVMIGSGANRQAGGACNVLENADVAGQIGFSIDCNNSTITAGGRQQLVTMKFRIAAKAALGRTSLAFGDSLARRSVSSNPSAGAIESLPTIFTSGSLNITAASSASVSGRVLSADGRGVSRAVVYLNGGKEKTLRATTNSFGYYRFEEVKNGESYTVNAKHRRFVFTERTVTVEGAIEGFDIAAQ